MSAKKKFDKKMFESDFCKETLDLLVLVKEGCYGGVYEDDKTLHCAVRFLASADPTTGNFSPAPGRLIWFAKSNSLRSGYGYKFDMFKLYKVRVRKHISDSTQYLLVKILSKRVHHPELDKLSEHYKKPVFLDSPCGSFKLNRSFSRFENIIDLRNDTVDIYLETDNADGDTAEKSLAVFCELLKHIEGWDKTVRLATADELLECANDWAADSCAEGEELKVITRESFAERIGLAFISIAADGEITVFYDDDDMFWGHSVVVTADASGNVSDATLMG